MLSGVLGDLGGVRAPIGVDRNELDPLLLIRLRQFSQARQV